jgi:hypothetical protein
MTRFYRDFIFSRRIFSKRGSGIFLLGIVAGILCILISCEDKTSIIGRDLLPPSDFGKFYATDTIRVITYTEYGDSIGSTNPATSYIGQIQDPYFGTTTAEVISQVRLGAAWDEEASYIVDSVKLFLKLLTVSGNTDVPQYLIFSEIDKMIYSDTVYYSSDPVPLTGKSWSGIQLPKLKADTVNQIEIDIPVSFGEYLIRDTSKLFYSSTDPDFRNYFNGLYFQLAPSASPVFVSLSLDSPGTYETYSNYFMLYMHEVGTTKSYDFAFILDAFSTNACYNRFVHDFDAADPDKKIQHINDGYPDSLAYVQIFSGVYTRISIPGLDDVKELLDMSKVSVNKSRLIFPIVYDDEIYKPATIPRQLYIRYITDAGLRYYVPDYYISTDFFDGTADTTANVYNLNLASYIQLFLADTTGGLTTDLELFLLPSSGNNVILKGSTSSNPVKFEFTYTEF